MTPESLFKLPELHPNGYKSVTALRTERGASTSQIFSWVPGKQRADRTLLWSSPGQGRSEWNKQEPALTVLGMSFGLHDRPQVSAQSLGEQAWRSESGRARGRSSTHSPSTPSSLALIHRFPSGLTPKNKQNNKISNNTMTFAKKRTVDQKL